MALKLRVISDHYKALGKRSSRLFGVTGGKIGRAQDNDWILPDPDRYVSSHHCKVDFRAGQWILEDTSTNGVFINGSDTPASVDGAYSLQDGDRLRLGDYEVLVSIDERNDFAADASGQIPAPPRVRNKSNVRTAPRATDNDLGEELDLTDLISDSAIAPAPSFPPPRRPSPSSAPLDLESALALDSDDLKAMGPIPAAPAPAKAPRTAFASLLGDSGEHKTVAHGRKAEAAPKVEEPRKPDDWHMQTRPYDRKALQALTSPAALAKPDKPEPERPKRVAESSSAEPATGVEAFCRGAGIDPASLPADQQNALLTLAGQMLREVRARPDGVAQGPQRPEEPHAAQPDDDPARREQSAEVLRERRRSGAEAPRSAQQPLSRPDRSDPRVVRGHPHAPDGAGRRDPGGGRRADEPHRARRAAGAVRPRPQARRRCSARPTR